MISIMGVTSFFVTANRIEAGLWGTMALVVVAYAATGRMAWGRSLAIAGLFVAFALSDLVETRTGAWWRPWWLLTWKGLCAALLVWQALRFRGGRAGRRPPESAP